MHILTLVAAIIMIILWTYSLGKSLSNPDIEVKVKQDLQPFSVLKDNLVGGYNSVVAPNPDAGNQ